MKTFKKSLLLTSLLLSFAVSGLAQPTYHIGSPGFSVHDLNMRPTHMNYGYMSPTHMNYGYMSPIDGHEGWNHYNGGLWHGPHYNLGDPTPWGWRAGYGWGAWPVGVGVGTAIGVTAATCCW